jgi:plastocyanin domain-containing protein
VKVKTYKIEATIRIETTEITARQMVTAWNPEKALIECGRKLERTWPNCTVVDVVVKQLNQKKAKVIDV